VDLLLDLERERDAVGVVELEVVQLLGREREKLGALEQQRVVVAAATAGAGGPVQLLYVRERDTLLQICREDSELNHRTRRTTRTTHAHARAHA
jgi:hypothetical protein